MIWLLYNIKNMSDKNYYNWYRMMDTEKKARVNRMLSPENRKQTVAGDHLARTLIAKQCKVIPENIRFDIGEHGKPRAIDLPVHFSVSHSKEFVFCVVDDHPVGADIERIRPIKIDMARKFCNPEEIIYLSEDHQRFFELWTTKEAHAKKSGIGLAIIKEIDFFEINNQTHTIQTKEYFLSITT